MRSRRGAGLQWGAVVALDELHSTLVCDDHQPRAEPRADHAARVLQALWEDGDLGRLVARGRLCGGEVRAISVDEYITLSDASSERLVVSARDEHNEQRGLHDDKAGKRGCYTMPTNELHVSFLCSGMKASVVYNIYYV